MITDSARIKVASSLGGLFNDIYSGVKNTFNVGGLDIQAPATSIINGVEGFAGNKALPEEVKAFLSEITTDPEEQRRILEKAVQDAESDRLRVLQDEDKQMRRVDKLRKNKGVNPELISAEEAQLAGYAKRKEDAAKKLQKAQASLSKHNANPGSGTAGKLNKVFHGIKNNEATLNQLWQLSKNTLDAHNSRMAAEEAAKHSSKGILGALRRHPVGAAATAAGVLGTAYGAKKLNDFSSQYNPNYYAANYQNAPGYRMGYPM